MLDKWEEISGAWVVAEGVAEVNGDKEKKTRKTNQTRGEKEQ